ncbi:MAG: response regulator [Synergistaceae bacterium]|nr:response regulator [Synergistaceae bacterium]
MAQILVVDDNLVSLKQIRALLGDAYDVSLVKSGPQALQVCYRERPDLILLDIDMPEMDGFETLARLKSNPYTASIPVIFLTGNTDAATEVRGLGAGAKDFLTKPVEQRLLKHRINLHLSFDSYQRHLERSATELSNSVAVSFSEMIECRDENTGKHVIRTSRYVRKIGEYLRSKGVYPDELTEESLEMMERGAPMHDIGKIGISDRVLLKPGRLDDNEFALMKKHTTIGADILEHMYARTPSLRYLRYAKMIAASHHERYDGCGYPCGLAGEAIPLCGRIMSVADVYDALVEDRVYRKKLSNEEAFSIIHEGKGKQFDPNVVDAFEAIYDELVSEKGLPV